MPKRIPTCVATLPTTGLPRALALFTDRDTERDLISQFFGALEREGDKPVKPLLSFYGVGGVGKTTLLHKAVQEFTSVRTDAAHNILHRAIAEWQERNKERLRIALLDVDHEGWTPSADPVQFIRLLRGRLADLGVGTPLLDLMLLAHWKRTSPGQELKIQSSPLQEFCGKASEYGEVLGVFSEMVGEGIGAIKQVAILDRVVGKLQKHRRNREMVALLTRHPEELSPHEQMLEMPTLLAADLEDWLVAHSKASLCIVVDGFERVQSTQSGDDIQRILVMLSEGILVNCSKPEIAHRVGFMFIGREKLRWRELYDEADTADEASWAAYIDSHLLGGLAETDARSFLVGKAAVSLEGQGTDGGIAAGHIRKHTGAILAAACEDQGEGARRSYYPYYLDLALELVVRSGPLFDPAVLGRTPRELQERFLKYLRDHRKPELRALQSLALCVEFDAEIFAYLVKEQLIAGYRISDFGQIVQSERSYVLPVADRPGAYRFHRHMHDALMGSQTQLPEDRSAAQALVERLLAWLCERSRFPKLADFHESHGRAYRQGITVLTHAGKARLLPGEGVARWFAKFEDPFDEHTFLIGRLAAIRMVDALLSESIGTENPQTLRLRSNLTLILEATADYSEALVVGRSTLEAQERVLGAEHPETLRSIGNLAKCYYGQGEHKEAELLYRRALVAQERILGIEHRETMQSSNNLAVCLDFRGEHVAAEVLYRRIWEARERVLGAEHPDTIHSVDNLAICLCHKGDFVAAEPLFRRAVEMQERVLGAEHVATLKSINNLAVCMDLRGDHNAAELLLRQALAAIERILGAEHHETLLLVNSLAVCLDAKGEHSNAEVLYRREVEVRERVLGPDHPSTLSAVFGLAVCVEGKGEYMAAGGFHRRTLEGRERVLGAEHFETLSSYHELAAHLERFGDLKEAEGFGRRAVASRERVLGTEHPDSRKSRDLLALIREKKGKT